MNKFADRRPTRADNRPRGCFVGQRSAGAGKLEKIARAVKTMALAELRQTFGDLRDDRTTGRHGARRGCTPC